MTTVIASTHLRASPGRVWDLATRPSTLARVSAGFLRFSGAGRFPERWKVGSTLTTRLWLAGVLPAPRSHTIEVVRRDERRRELRSEEHGGPIRSGNHRLEISPEGSGPRYVDEIEIDTGPLTGLAVAFARVFYAYRQARWRRLVRDDVRRLESAFAAYRDGFVLALRRRVGAEAAASLVDEMLGAIRDLAPRVPLARPGDPMRANLFAGAVMLAAAGVLGRAGLDVDAVSAVIAQTATARLNRYPSWLVRILGGLRFTSTYQRRLAARAAISHRRAYPGEWVFDYVPGDERTFDFGIDYLACPILDLYGQEGRTDLMPKICELDCAISGRMRDGLVRTTTLAEGASQCDFPYGGVGRYGVPYRERRSR